MTSGSVNSTGRAPGWFVHTDLGVTLSDRFDTLESARAAYWDVVAELRREMTQAHRTRSSIEAHVAAVHVGYGVQVGVWGGFEARTAVSPST